jgi:hypothetical protein
MPGSVFLDRRGARRFALACNSLPGSFPGISSTFGEGEAEKVDVPRLEAEESFTVVTKAEAGGVWGAATVASPIGTGVPWAVMPGEPFASWKSSRSCNRPRRRPWIAPRKRTAGRRGWVREGSASSGRRS